MTTCALSESASTAFEEDDEFDVANVHFFVGLFTPIDRAGWIRVGGVVFAVVVPCGVLQLRAGFNLTWFRVFVSQLPVEVVAWDVEQSLCLAVL